MHLERCGSYFKRTDTDLSNWMRKRVYAIFSMDGCFVISKSRKRHSIAISSVKIHWLVLRNSGVICKHQRLRNTNLLWCTLSRRSEALTSRTIAEISNICPMHHNVLHWPFNKWLILLLFLMNKKSPTQFSVDVVSVLQFVAWWHSMQLQWYVPV